MKWFKRRSQINSAESLEALAQAEAMADKTQVMSERASKIAAERQAHLQSNGFAELIAGVLRK